MKGSGMDTTQNAVQHTEVAPRFFMEHGVWHDRETGQHLWTQGQYDEESRAQYLAGAEDQANGILPEWATAKIKTMP